MNIKQRLGDLSEPKFQIFQSKLLPGVSNITGVRLPNLRKIAQEIATSDWKGYLKHAEDDTFEETMLQGMVIGAVETDLDELLPYIEAFIPKITNWSICDSFCAGLKITKKYKEQMWGFLQPFLKSSQEYEIRFVVVMLLSYYIDETYLQQNFQVFDEITLEAYYVKMAVAWAVSICFVHFPEETMRYLKKNQLSNWTYRKALQKITESLQVDEETKKIVKEMKKNATIR